MTAQEKKAAKKLINQRYRAKIAAKKAQQEADGVEKARVCPG